MHWDRYWDIILYRSYAELKAEAQLNYMGYVWWLLEPLLNTILFYVILVYVLEQKTADSISFTLVGAVIWQWTDASINTSAGSILDAGGMLKHIYLPKIVLPLIILLTTTWKFIFLFALLLAWVWFSGHTPHASYSALPLIMVLQALLISSLSLPLAVIMPYFPDMRIAIAAALRSLMLVSGTFFPIEQLPAAYHRYFYMNPIAVIIAAYRNVLLDGHWPSFRLLGYVGLFSLIVLSFTLLLYQRLDRSIVKAIHR